MLASLLPGLRELRAPLAAGYLWLVTGWLVLRDRVDTDSQAVQGLLDLRDVTSTAGYIAALSFIAFMLGALWEAFVASVVGAVRRLVIQRENFLGPELSLHDASERRARGARISAEGSRLVLAICQRLYRSVEEVLQEVYGPGTGATQLLNHYPIERERGTHVLDPVDWPLLREDKWGSPYDEWWKKEEDIGRSWGIPDLWQALDSARGFRVERNESIMPILEPAWQPLAALKESGNEYETWVLMPRDLAQRVIRELPLTARRMVGEEKELYIELDRMKAEVDFRYTIAVPLAITGGVVSFGLQLPSLAVVGCAIGAAAAAVLLIVDGLRRDRERNELLLDLIRIGKASSPTFSRLVERAKATRDAIRREEVVDV
jgi:hypothetical protein